MTGSAAPALNGSHALFLDFDGVLVDFADEPHLVSLEPGMTGVIDRLRFKLGDALAVISGRPITEVHVFMSPMKLPIAGQHGREIVFADGHIESRPAPDIENERKAIKAFAGRHEDLLCEAKTGSVALHYRKAPHLEDECRNFMQSIALKRSDLKLLAGKMVLELKEPDVDKGAAIKRFMETAPFSDRTPVFVGDDATDEDGFRAVNELAGISIKVGEGETQARYRLADVAAVHTWLRDAAAGGIAA